MIEITKEVIKKIANTSNLILEDFEIALYQKDFKEILSTFEKLNEVDTDNVKSSFQPIQNKNKLREDKVGKSISQKEALKFTKTCENGFFVGPKTID